MYLWCLADQEMDFDDSDISPKEVVVRSLRGQRLQVITKLVDYGLSPGEEYEGVWHVEGMSHEAIICTVLYIMDR